MFRVSRFFALVVLAVWFSATQHCELAGLGWSLSAASRVSERDCAQDSCAQVENGSYRVQNEALKAPAPTLIAVDPIDPSATTLALTLLHREAAPERSAAATERPRNWVPTWHLVRRAAPPARAPALLCA